MWRKEDLPVDTFTVDTGWGWVQFCAKQSDPTPQGVFSD